jgi:hypothetical protein
VASGSAASVRTAAELWQVVGDRNDSNATLEKAEETRRRGKVGRAVARAIATS